MIQMPFGPWNPDSASINTKHVLEAVNVLPGTSGFLPSPGLAAASANALNSDCFGACTVISSTGIVSSFAGTATKLYKLGVGASWADVSRLAGGPYAVGAGEKWKFELFGDLLVASNIDTFPQKFNLLTSTNFEALGGTPPKARYIAVVRDFIFLGCLLGFETKLQWSGINNSEHWTPGTQSSDDQTFPSGSTIRGMLGGEVGYIFQASRVVRATFHPGSEEIFSFDEIEGGRGLSAPHSLVQVGAHAYYWGSDAIYKFDMKTASATPIGIGKWERTVRNDMKPGTELLVLGGHDPARRLIYWSYCHRASVGLAQSRVVVYDWAIDEATIIDLPIGALAQWLTQGVSLDALGAFGTLDTLPFSLDSPAWRGGAGLLGVFSASDDKLSFFSGANMAARITTTDFDLEKRQLIVGAIPYVDTASTTVALAARERDADSVVYGASEAMETTGICPQHKAGSLFRAQINVATGAVWSQIKGLKLKPKNAGTR